MASDSAFGNITRALTNLCESEQSTASTSITLYYVLGAVLLVAGALLYYLKIYKTGAKNNKILILSILLALAGIYFIYAGFTDVQIHAAASSSCTP